MPVDSANRPLLVAALDLAGYAGALGARMFRQGGVPRSQPDRRRSLSPRSSPSPSPALRSAGGVNNPTISPRTSPRPSPALRSAGVGIGLADVPPKQLPTSRHVMHSLPRIKVTAHDIQRNRNDKCTICLDSLSVGEPASRLPCDHLFHDFCILPWLRSSNQCPVCRYELPTNDWEFEQGRVARMAGRKLRLRKTDLCAKTAQELRRLSEHLCLDTRGCLEKAEFIERISTSCRVELVSEETDVDAGAVTHGANASRSHGSSGVQSGFSTSWRSRMVNREGLEAKMIPSACGERPHVAQLRSQLAQPQFRATASSSLLSVVAGGPSEGIVGRERGTGCNRRAIGVAMSGGA